MRWANGMAEMFPTRESYMDGPESVCYTDWFDALALDHGIEFKSIAPASRDGGVPGIIATIEEEKINEIWGAFPYQNGYYYAPECESWKPRTHLEMLS